MEKLFVGHNGAEATPKWQMQLTQGPAPLREALMHRKGPNHADEAGAYPHHPTQRWISSTATDTSLWTQDTAVTPWETEAKGLICRNVSPDLPNSCRPA